MHSGGIWMHLGDLDAWQMCMNTCYAYKSIRMHTNVYSIYLCMYLYRSLICRINSYSTYISICVYIHLIFYAQCANIPMRDLPLHGWCEVGWIPHGHTVFPYRIWSIRYLLWTYIYIYMHICIYSPWPPLRSHAHFRPSLQAVPFGPSAGGHPTGPIGAGEPICCKLAANRNELSAISLTLDLLISMAII